VISGVDISNHQGLPANYRNEKWYQDAEFVIAQAIPRPAPNGVVGEQLRAARDDGKSLGSYCWLWHDPSWRLGPTVREDQLRRLETIPDDVTLNMRLWLDIEDNQSTGWNNVSVQQRVEDVWEALRTLDEWSIDRGLPLAGIYWSRWFIDLLFDGVDYFGRYQWLAHYGITPGSLIGGLVVAHQYASTPIDLDFMLDSEIVTAVPPDDPPADCAGLINGLAHVADDLGDQLLAEAKRSSVRKTVVRQIVKEMQRVRTEEVGPRP
jgi:hypothetical protein